MNRVRHIFLLLFMSLILFSSCSEKPTVDNLAFRLLNLYPSIPPCSQYIKNGEPYTTGYLSPEDFAFLYTGQKNHLPEWDWIEEFRLILSDSTTFFEIHIIKTKTASDIDEIAKLLNRRAQLLLLHNKTEEDFRVEEPLVYITGRYAILVATDDNESAYRLLKKLL